MNKVGNPCRDHCLHLSGRNYSTLLTRDSTRSMCGNAMPIREEEDESNGHEAKIGQSPMDDGSENTHEKSRINRAEGTKSSRGCRTILHIYEI